MTPVRSGYFKRVKTTATMHEKDQVSIGSPQGKRRVLANQVSLVMAERTNATSEGSMQRKSAHVQGY